jgi:hypothetical protein
MRWGRGFFEEEFGPVRPEVRRKSKRDGLRGGELRKRKRKKKKLGQLRPSPLSLRGGHWKEYDAILTLNRA